MNRGFLFLVFFSFIPLVPTAEAQLLVDHQAEVASESFLLTPALSFSEVEYDVDGRGDADVERNILGVSAAFGLHPVANLFGEVGYVIESEIEGGSGDGDGVLVGLGAFGPLYNAGSVEFRYLAGLRLIDEDYGSGADGELVELHGGLSARGQLTPALGLYGGLDLIPLSDGDVEGPRGGDRDFDRDSPLGFRFGGDYKLDNGMRLNAEIAFLSETGLTLRWSIPL